MDASYRTVPQVIHDVHSFLSYLNFVLNPAKRHWEIFCMLWSSGRSPLMLISGNCLSQIAITHHALAGHHCPCSYFHTIILPGEQKMEEIFVFNT